MFNFEELQKNQKDLEAPLMQKGVSNSEPK